MVDCMTDRVVERFVVQASKLAGLQTITRQPIDDSRGWFERTYCFDTFAQLGIGKTISQINRSFTVQKGSVRGMHFQTAPFAETKFVSCLKGEVFDVAVDLRADSPTFLQWQGEILSADNHRSLLIPEGFAHGFQTLSVDCEMLYLHTQKFDPASSSGINPLDQLLAIDWPLPITEMSDGDRQRPMMLPTFEGL
jgi:dTDP-4-dehydrorhamnose 3,5-epimerase